MSIPSTRSDYMSKKLPFIHMFIKLIRGQATYQTVPRFVPSESKFVLCSFSPDSPTGDPRARSPNTLIVQLAHTQTTYGIPPVRQSYFIRRKQATNFAPAIRLADRLGCPLNRFVTINFTHTQCS